MQQLSTIIQQYVTLAASKKLASGQQPIVNQSHKSSICVTRLISPTDMSEAQWDAFVIRWIDNIGNAKLVWGIPQEDPVFSITRAFHGGRSCDIAFVDVPTSMTPDDLYKQIAALKI